MSYYAIRFPDYALPSGRVIRIELFKQKVAPTVEPPITSPVSYPTVNPWLKGGEPVVTDSAAPAAGTFGIDSITLQYLGIPVLDGLSLYQIINSIADEDYLWSIRVMMRTVPGQWPEVPLFWGYIESSEPAGELESYTDKSVNRYQLTARNMLAVLERVSVLDWITGFFQYNTPGLEIAPSLIRIDRYPLENILHLGEWRPSSMVRFVRFLDLVDSIGDAVAMPHPVNRIRSIRSSWEFYAMDAAGNLSAYTADDLCLASGVRTPTYWYWHYTLFDWEKHSRLSLFHCENILAVLKTLLVPLGLCASIETEATDRTFLSVREPELSSGSYGVDLLRGAELSEGGNSRTGLRVVIASAGEIAVNSTGGESIDCPYMSASRIRAGERWTHKTGGTEDHDTDDLECLFGSLWVLDSATNEMRSVSRIVVHRDGEGSRTVDTSFYSPLTLDNGSRLVAEAAAAYFYNNTHPDIDQLGVYRRSTKGLRVREYGLQDTVLGVAEITVSGRLYKTDAFPLPNEAYKYRRVRKLEDGAETTITGKTSNHELALADDIFVAGDVFLILTDRPGDFKYMPDGLFWTIRSIARNTGENTTEYQLERGSAE